jgi:hypothetical protein
MPCFHCLFLEIAVTQHMPDAPVLDHHASAYRNAIGWSFAIGLLAFAKLINIGGNLLGDPDTQWHVVVGRMIVEQGRVPFTDQLSHTFAGHPWIAKEWLSQVLMSAATHMGGWHGLVTLAVACVAFCIALVSWAMIEKTGNVLLGILVAILAFITLSSTILARPHIIALPVMALWTLIITRYAAKGDSHPPWSALLLMVLWSNLHAAFTIGFIIYAALAVEALLRVAPAERVRTFLGWAGFGALALGASMLNPYGWSSILLTFQMAGANEAVPLIDEWTPMSFGLRFCIIMLAAASLIAAMAIADCRKNAGRIILGIFVTWLAFRYERFVMVLTIVLPLISADSVGEVFRRGRVKIGTGVAQHWPPVLAGAGMAAVALSVMNPASVPETRYPMAAFEAVPIEVRQQNVFNSYNLGGFLIGQGVKTFIDGRSDQLFLGGFVTTYAEQLAARNGAYRDEMVSKFNIGWAFVITGNPEQVLFASAPGWREVYTDKYASVYIKKALPMLQSSHGEEARAQLTRP